MIKKPKCRMQGVLFHFNYGAKIEKFQNVAITKERCSKGKTHQIKRLLKVSERLDDPGVSYSIFCVIYAQSPP